MSLSIHGVFGKNFSVRSFTKLLTRASSSPLTSIILFSSSVTCMLYGMMLFLSIDLKTFGARGAGCDLQKPT
jgi:hypothetical protein